MNSRDPIDLDVEYFNPKVALARYEREGYNETEIKALLAFDAAIYARPADEIRKAKRAQDARNRRS